MAGGGPVAAGAVLLAGGRSTRMGAPKATLDWHGCPLVRRVAGLLLRAVDGPVLVVAAAGQALPALPPGVDVQPDLEPGLGPLAGLATGLAALAARGVPVAFACSVDLPLLHPALVHAVLRALPPDLGGAEAAAPEPGGRLQPLAAGYRTSLAPAAARLLAAGERRATALLEAVAATRLDRDRLLADPALAAGDPELLSLTNLNRPEDYRAALQLPAPEVGLRRDGAAGRLRAWTLGELLATRQASHPRGGVLLNGAPAPLDPWLPLLAGDQVELG